MKSMFIPIFAALFLMLAPSSSFTSFAPMKVHRSPLFAASKDTEAVKKADFVSSVSEKAGLSKADAEAALAAVIDTITEEVASGKKISMLGFGTFKLTHRAARMGRNPKTGEPLQIKASKSPSFTASKAFKEKCNPPKAD